MWKLSQLRVRPRIVRIALDHPALSVGLPAFQPALKPGGQLPEDLRVLQDPQALVPGGWVGKRWPSRHRHHHALEEAVKVKGTDAKLVQTASGDVALVSMTAKIISILSAKMANLVPGGGVWLNTQRPEWNDANNALAGYGLSMVTLCYMRRFMAFLLDLYRASPVNEFSIPAETADFFLALGSQYRANDPSTLQTPTARRAFSAGRAVRNREHRAIAGLALGLGLLALWRAACGDRRAR